MSRKRTMLLAVLVCLLVAFPFGPAARGQEARSDEGVRLTLAEALRAGLENNLGLVIARRAPRIASLTVDKAMAPFDPILGASGTYQESKDEPSAVFQASRSKGTALGASWTQNLKFGADYGVALDTTRTDAPNSFFSYNPRETTALRLTFNMPLLKGFGTESTTETLVIAKRGVEISEAELKSQAQTTIGLVEDAYWNLVAAREALTVARKSLKLAQDLYDLNKKKVEVGTLAPIEITQAEAGVASREEGVIVAETNLRKAQDVLRQLLAVPKDSRLWDQEITPADAPTFEPRSPDLDRAIEKALESRAEMTSARLDLRNKELTEQVTRRNLKPSLKLAAAVTPSGNNLLGYRIVGTPPDEEAVPRVGSWADSVTEIPKFRNYDWSLGLVYTYPLANRMDKANYAIATVEREKAELSLQNEELTVRVDVRNAVRAVESGVKRVNAARANTVLQQKKLEAEQKKFENGMSTSFEVLTFQTDLANAQQSEIQALIDYRKSLAALEQAQGTLLEARGLRLESGKGK